MSGDGISVHGGSGGNIACLMDLDLLAQKLELAADRVEEARVAGGQAVTALGESPGPFSHYDLGGGSSAIAWPPQAAVSGLPLTPTELSVRSSAIAEAETFQGSAGVGGLDGELEELAVKVRQARAGYDQAERAAEAQISAWAEARTSNINLLAQAGPLGWAVASNLLGLSALLGVSRSIVNGTRPPSLAELFRDHQPDIRSMLAAGVLPPFRFLKPSTSDVARGAGALTVAQLPGGGSWAVIERGATTTGRPAAGVAGLVERVMALARSRKEGQAKIAVSKVVSAKGDVSWLVMIPGTNDMRLGAGQSPQDNGTNIQAVAGDTNVIGMATMAALKDLGVKKGEPVVLAGHSQGGIVSAQFASDPDFNRAVSVAGVLTLGSPVSEMKPRAGQQWLSLEHSQDIIPALAPPNERGANHTTVVRDLSTASDPAVRTTGLPRSGLSRAHSGEAYADTGRLIDENGSSSLDTWRRTVAPVLDQGATVTTTEYEVRRSDTAPGDG